MAHKKGVGSSRNGGKAAANRSASDRSDAAKKGWETRRRNAGK